VAEPAGLGGECKKNLLPSLRREADNIEENQKKLKRENRSILGEAQKGRESGAKESQKKRRRGKEERVPTRKGDLGKGQLERRWLARIQNCPNDAAEYAGKKGEDRQLRQATSMRQGTTTFLKRSLEKEAMPKA